MERKNINRGFKKLRVWQDAVSLYVLNCNLLKKFPFEFKKVVSNCIDASQSISRNIAEGYCRRSLKEYLIHLNYALGSCGELHSCFETFLQAHQISNEEYENLDLLQYKIENELIKLIKTLQVKQKYNLWDESFVKEAIE
jgi:four helix bundle protein